MKELEKYLKNVKKANLKKLESIEDSFVLEPSGQSKIYNIRVRKNPVFCSKSRIVPERETRKIETISFGFKTQLPTDCFFCDPKNKGAKFAKETGLEEQYYLNASAAFSNLFTFAKIHGVLLFYYKQHITDPRGLKLENWIDGIKLVQKIGRKSGKKYVSMNINFGFKAGASLEHFHGQFLCEDEPLSKTSIAMKLGSKNYWKSWVKAMMEEKLMIDFDSESKTVFFAEWSPAFSKTELVVMNLDSPSLLSLNEKEIEASAKFIDKAVKITIENVSDEFNMVNLSASPKSNFCNQFRIFPRAPSSHGAKSWEGFLEFSGETVPHISPERLVELAKKY